jgi:hypothetical protein
MDINGNVPDRNGLNEDSLEAVLQDLLSIAARDGGAWLLGRHVFWTKLLEGEVLLTAYREAVSAAAGDDNGAIDRVKQAMDKYAEWYPTNAQPATKPGARGFLLDLAEAFGRRSTPAHR